jgi:uroporphyrin-III C-methyltransferase/precorrin-2 dehydrogenase/sirohydrochlorin ferrochelatase
MAGTCKRQSELLESGIGELSLLPVFLDLKGKKALVIGTSQGAKWKVELLRATGALVQQLDSPSVTGNALRDYAFIVADIAHDLDAAKFAGEAQAAGVAFNMVDRPELCQFQFGAIVNRSPVIVGISTNGAAPVLAQTIRQRVESILPENLGAWGALAKRLRGRITVAIHDSSLRRAVWQRFAGLAMGGVDTTEYDEHSLLASLLETSTNHHKPIILEIPLERDLMTLRNCRVLMNADIVHDYSGRDFVKSLMRREAEYVRFDLSESGDGTNNQIRNVVICISSARPDWRVTDFPGVEEYRPFP